MHSPSSGHESALPRRIDTVDVAALDLTPAEAFVLTQLDGSTELAEVALVTGLSEDEVALTVKRLVELGAVAPGAPVKKRGAARVDPRRDDDEPITREEVFRPAPTHRTRERAIQKPDVERVELDPERRELIDDFCASLDSATHYQLLGLEPSASRSDVKEAYFRLIGTFHPDRYFGRKLGGYQKKLDQAFGGLTRAYEVLSRQRSRDEYDEYLGLKRATRALDAVIRSIPPARPQQVPTFDTPTRSEAIANAKKKRQRLADRMRSAKSSESESGAKLSHDEALDRLRRLAAESSTRQRSKTASFREAGERALDARQWTAAVNSLRIATVLAPDDEQISASLRDAEQHAAEELADTYRARAEYEERNQQWVEAAASYQQVAAGHPKDAEPLARAARCLLHAGQSREAVNLARQAVLLEPDASSHRLTLARAYEANDLLSSAIGELERADALKKGDKEIKAWIARVQKAQRESNR